MFYAFFVIYTFRKIIQRGIKTMKKLKNKSKKIMMAAVIGLSLLFSSCSFFQHAQIKTEITDISKDTGFSEIVTQGYMGGSLVYNDKNVSLGQLAEGVCAGIRLSKAESKEVGNGQTVFKEIDNSAQYGLLQIEEIDNKKISFGIKLYNLDGTAYTEKHFILAENEQVDVNDDGLMDLEYKEPLRKRSGFEKSMYLNFLSSQQDLNITMFAVLKEQYPDETYPNGIIGINNDGRFIIQKYCDSENTQRSVVRGAYQGDYVLDTENGTYKRIKSNSYSRNARAIDDCDLETIDEQLITDAFYFTDEDFAFYSTDELIAALPTEITSKYTETGIEKLNRILEDKALIPAIAATQDTILTEEQKEEITSQFNLLTAEEIVQINRVFLEQNYSYICPQRVTVAQSITEILPLASVVFTVDDLNGVTLDKIRDYESVNLESEEDDSSRAATKSASFKGAKDLADYKKKLAKMEGTFDEYNNWDISDLKNIPISNQKKKNKNGNTPIYTSSFSIKDGRVAIGIKGHFNITWKSVDAGISVAAFVKAGAGVSINVTRSDEELENLNKTTTVTVQPTQSSKTENEKKEIKVIKDKITLLSFEKNFSLPIKVLSFGPISLSINPSFGIGIPVAVNIELDCGFSYDVYIAGLAQAGFSVGMDWGVNWTKKWIIKVPNPYFNYNGNSFASADSIYYVDTDLTKLGLNNIDFNALKIGFTISPYIKFGLEASATSFVHAGFSISTGFDGYANFNYEKSRLYGNLGLNQFSKIQANVFLGLKNLTILGIIHLGDQGKNWTWDLFNSTTPIIPEYEFLNLKI